MKKIIDLSNVPNGVIDLSKYEDFAEMKGHFKGGSLIFKNGRMNQYITAKEFVSFDGSGFSVKAIDCVGLDFKFNQGGFIKGIQVVGDLHYLGLDSPNLPLTISGGDSGLHMTQHTGKEKYGFIILEGVIFSDNEHEGMYIGSHKEDTKEQTFIKGVSFTATNCVFVNNGWDGAQLAHFNEAKFKNCIFDKNGNRGTRWQDKDFILNYGVGRCDLDGCTVGKNVQVLGTSKLFIY